MKRMMICWGFGGNYQDDYDEDDDDDDKEDDDISG